MTFFEDDIVNVLRLEAEKRETLAFVRESNRIEGITREPTSAELAEYRRFMKLKRITVAQLERFVSVYQPAAVLRREPGVNVRVGEYVPPLGGPDIERELRHILLDVALEQGDPHETHLRYESLHPFTDCNGRSGRMLWMWQMRRAPLGFLHQFYYQTLAR